MTLEEKKNAICNIILEEGKITTKQLRELGFKKHEIAKLVKDGILTRIKIGEYKLNDIDLLYNYGLNFLEKAETIQEENEKTKYKSSAIECFIKGHEMDKTNRNINLQLLLHFIINKDYGKAYEILACMYDTADEKNIKENNLFLYLLGCYERCPLNLYVKISSHRPENFTLNDFDDDEARLIVSKIYSQQYDEARELILNMEIKNPGSKVKRDILLEFLKKSILNVSFADLQATLKNDKVDDFYKLLRLYLRIIGREEYEPLIFKLTNLCVLDGNHTYNIVFRELVEMEKEDYTVDATVFIRDFYNYVFNEEYKQASICLSIIEKFGNLPPEIVADLRKKVVWDSKSATTTNELTPEEKVETELTNIVKKMIEDNATVAVIPDVSPKYAEDILNVLKKSSRDSLLANIKFWSCGNTDKTIVLRRTNPQAPRINFGERLSQINRLFNEKKYNDCITLIEELLQNWAFKLGNLESTRRLFYILGKSCMRNKVSNNKNKAIKFLLLVTKVNSLMPPEEQDDQYDFTKKSEAMAGKQARDNKSKKRNRRIDKARSILPPREDIDWNGFFGTTVIGQDIESRLSKLQDILYTSIELEQPLSKVIEAHKLSEEDVLMMRLIKARDYYIDSLYQEGDYELSIVTLNSNKTPLIDTLARQIFSHRFDYRRMASAHSKKRVMISDFEEDLAA